LPVEYCRCPVFFLGSVAPGLSPALAYCGRAGIAGLVVCGSVTAGRCRLEMPHKICYRCRRGARVGCYESCPNICSRVHFLLFWLAKSTTQGWVGHLFCLHCRFLTQWVGRRQVEAGPARKILTRTSN